jgi:hypothetical protein
MVWVKLMVGCQVAPVMGVLCLAAQMMVLGVLGVLEFDFRLAKMGFSFELSFSNGFPEKL